MKSFCDQAETHIFSDWLLSYVLGAGIENLDEYYIGLPDLSTFFDRSGSEPLIHWQNIQSSWVQSKTSFKKLIQQEWKKSLIIDLGAGRPELSLSARILALLSHAKEYIAVESDHRWESLADFSGLKVTAVKSDLLEYLEQYQIKERVCFLLCGIEVPDELGKEAIKIREKLLKLLYKRTQAGDLVIFGAGTTELEFPNSEFNLIYSDPQHFVWRRRPSWQQKLFSLLE